jgi:long-chain acyl-CoA synthetase
MSVPVTPLAQLFDRAYEQFAGRAAIRDAATELTLAELGARARRTANAFRSLGAEPGSRMVILAPNSCQWIEAGNGMVLGGYARVALLPRPASRVG